MLDPARSRSSSTALTLLLLGSVGGFVYLARPFVGALLVAGMVVIVVWPLHARVQGLVRRRLVATVISFLILALVLGSTVGVGVGIVLPEIGRLSSELADAAREGAVSATMESLDLGVANAFLERLTGQPTDLVAEAVDALQSVLGDLAGGVAGAVPTLLQVTGMALLQLVIFLLALGTFLMSGPELVAWIRRVAPLAPHYSDQLMAIFASFSRNVVAASLAGALAQGTVAGVGYGLAGVERAAFFGVLSAVAAAVPMVGPMLVWIPIAVLLFAQGRPGTAVFVLVWNAVLTGTVDNLIKPLVVRGRSDLPPLLIFIGVFGGLSSMGLVGLLVGPIVAAMMMALFTIHEERQVAKASMPGFRRIVGLPAHTVPPTTGPPSTTLPPRSSTG